MTLTHKNYTGEYHYNPSDGMYSGRITGIEDFVAFYGGTEHEIKHEFVKAVETYIESTGNQVSALEKLQQFKLELSALLAKYKAEISSEETRAGFFENSEIVVTFENGIVPDLHLGKTFNHEIK